eukprot:PhM_4_TR6715/c0_g1_i1/m.10826
MGCSCCRPGSTASSTSVVKEIGPGDEAFNPIRGRKSPRKGSSGDADDGTRHHHRDSNNPVMPPAGSTGTPVLTESKSDEVMSTGSSTTAPPNDVGHATSPPVRAPAIEAQCTAPKQKSA